MTLQSTSVTFVDTVKALQYILHQLSVEQNKNKSAMRSFEVKQQPSDV